MREERRSISDELRRGLQQALRRENEDRPESQSEEMLVESMVQSEGLAEASAGG